jgi:hypothetical protein
VLWRTDRIIADIRMRHLLLGLGLRPFAALIVAYGLLMLELSAYFALVQFWSPIVAAAALGTVNFVMAAVLFTFAARQVFQYDSSPCVPEDSGTQLAEHFVAGEYASVNKCGKAHIYRVA